ncbi:hypothetical protein IQ89_18675 [Salmonella enterica]|nr:hypothetical protein [Salmonella enterica]EDV4943752.1 hypothetical protein [Salmonella enterica subsp. arizonae]
MVFITAVNKSGFIVGFSLCFQPDAILPSLRQQLDSLPLSQTWHKQDFKPGWPEKGRRNPPHSVCFFTYNYSLLFTQYKNIIKTIN